MTQTRGERGTSLFVVSLRRPGSGGSPYWRCRVRHVANGSAALILDVGGLASFINACLGTGAFPEETVAPQEQREE
ncbi:MAG: hypothetical protein HY690_00945 [Chloroflexi bacterium]|nr:hypothetical protein [Chloroflexota bacterium]